MIAPVNLAQAFERFSETWSPKVVGQVNDFHVKLAKLHGEFVWHSHEDEDEMFFVVKGTLRIRLRDGADLPGSETADGRTESSAKEITLRPGEFVVIPRGVEHLPIADEECHVMLLEPASTLNTGNVRDARTVDEPERLT